MVIGVESKTAGCPGKGSLRPLNISQSVDEFLMRARLPKTCNSKVLGEGKASTSNQLPPKLRPDQPIIVLLDSDDDEDKDEVCIAQISQRERQEVKDGATAGGACDGVGGRQLGDDSEGRRAEEVKDEAAAGGVCDGVGGRQLGHESEGKRAEEVDEGDRGYDSEDSSKIPLSQLVTSRAKRNANLGSPSVAADIKLIFQANEDVGHEDEEEVSSEDEEEYEDGDDRDYEQDSDEELEQSIDSDNDLRWYPRRREHHKEGDRVVYQVPEDVQKRVFRYQQQNYCYSGDVFALMLGLPNTGLDLKALLKKIDGKDIGIKYFGWKTSDKKQFKFHIEQFQNFGSPKEESVKLLLRTWNSKLHNFNNMRMCTKGAVVAAIQKVQGKDVNYPQYISDFLHSRVVSGTSSRTWSLCLAVIDFHTNRNGKHSERGAFGLVDYVDGPKLSPALVRESHQQAPKTDLGLPIMDSQNDPGNEADHGNVAVTDPGREVENGRSSTLIEDVTLKEVAFAAASKDTAQFKPLKQEPHEARAEFSAWRFPDKGEARVSKIEEEFSAIGIRPRGGDVVEEQLWRAANEIEKLLSCSRKEREARIRHKENLEKAIKEREAEHVVLERNLQRHRDETRDLHKKCHHITDLIQRSDESEAELQERRKRVLNNLQKRKRQQEEKGDLEKRHKNEAQEVVKDLLATTRFTKQFASNYLTFSGLDSSKEYHGTP